MDDVLTGAIGSGARQLFSYFIDIADSASDALYYYGTFIAYRRYGTLYFVSRRRYTRIAIAATGVSLLDC